ncbi:MAG: aminotransferase class V-fold PLP-dependent enzyme [Flavobacteriaceae bacterium]|nr:aminotransferase class V-fold PLP-dependent enzyme [Flavobacteriaceae bacterium]
MNCQKHLFQLDQDIHYLNCAYKAPMLRSAENACIRALKRERIPVNLEVKDFFDPVTKAKELFGKLIGGEADQVVLVSSCSYGFASALQNLEGKKDGKAITVSDEFPSGYFSLERWCKENNNALEVVAQTATGNWNQNLLASITPDTSVVLISSVHWMNGYMFDLEAIGKKCKESGAIFMVDGTQSVGAKPIDVMACKIDVLVCATYKWLFGPYGIAVAYIDKKFNFGKPLEEAWLNREEAEKFEALTQYQENYKAGAARFNVGESSNFLLVPVLNAGLQQILDWQPENIKKYAETLRAPLIQYLEKIGVQTTSLNSKASHIFALPVPAGVETETLKTELAKRQVFVSIRGPYLRVAIHLFNTKEDIQALIDAIDACLSK